MDMRDVKKATSVLTSVVGVTIVAYGIFLLTERKDPPLEPKPPSSIESFREESSEKAASEKNDKASSTN